MDKYSNFAELKLSETGSAYAISHRKTNIPIAILAPHGGKIEPGTSEIARSIAGTDYCLYTFDGCKPSNNRDLHITSTNFDEPNASAIVEDSQYVIAIHGCQGNDSTFYLGGNDIELRDNIGAQLLKAGFKTGIHSNPALQGTHPANICNRGLRKRGVQIEVSRDIRDRICTTEGAIEMKNIANAIRTAIADLGGSM